MNILALATRGYLWTMGGPSVGPGPSPDIHDVVDEKPRVKKAKMATVAGPTITGARKSKPSMSGSISRQRTTASPSITGSKTDKPQIKKKE